MGYPVPPRPASPGMVEIGELALNSVDRLGCQSADARPPPTRGFTMSRKAATPRPWRPLGAATAVIGLVLSLVGFGASAALASTPSAIASGQQLNAGQDLVSPNGAYELAMQGDGNLVVYMLGGPVRAVWASNTGGHPGAIAAMQGDGNLVVYQAGHALWDSGTYGHPGNSTLAMQTDGNLVIYGPGGPLWATGTYIYSVLPAPGGSRLVVGQSLRSSSGQYKFIMQSDGNLVLYGPHGATWASHTGQPGSFAILQSDGNLVVYGPNGAVWSSITGGYPGDSLVVQNDGNTVIYGAGRALWSTSSGRLGCPTNNAGYFGADPNAMTNTGNGTQLITVSDPSNSSTSGKLTAWDKTGGCWVPHSFPGQPAQPYRAETGYSGIKPYAIRVSGDGSTPQGFFGFERTMYGVSGSSPNGRYGYQHLVCGDWWDEQPGSPTYDTFQAYPCGVTPPFGGDSEHLWTETVAYQHFAVLGLPHPPEAASGIFLHDYTNSGVTAGCIALPPGELDAVLGWMNPADNPGIAIGTTGVMNGL